MAANLFGSIRRLRPSAEPNLTSSRNNYLSFLGKKQADSIAFLIGFRSWPLTGFKMDRAWKSATLAGLSSLRPHATFSPDPSYGAPMTFSSRLGAA